MDADYDIYEIVKVIPDYRLFDSESYQRDYCTSQGEPLMPGYYVVSWPETIRIRRFNEFAAFHGPFRFRKEAYAFLKVMQQHKYMLIMSPKKWPVVADAINVEEQEAA